MHTIAVVNRKGGVGKTTTTAHLAHALARSGKSVLAIDCDSQKASITTWLAASEPDTQLADVMLDPKIALSAVVASTAKGVELICGSSRTLETERDLTAKATIPTIFRRIFRELSKFDYVLLDCPPSLGGIVVSALVAVDEVIVPVTGRGMSLDAVVEVRDLLDEIMDGELREKIPTVRILITEYDSRLRLGQAVRNELAKLSDHRDNNMTLFKTVIRRNERLAESYGARTTVFDYDAKAFGAIDYQSLAAEVLM